MAVDELSTVFDDNVGIDDQFFTTLELTNGLANSATFTVPGDTPFIYDPTEGNLLLDIHTDSPETQFPFEFFESMNGDADGLFSIMQDFGTSESDGYGLVTQLHFTTIPEPSTATLLTLGLLGIGTWRRRAR